MDAQRRQVALNMRRGSSLIVALAIGAAGILSSISVPLTEAHAAPRATVVALRIRLGKQMAGHTTRDCKIRVPTGSSGATVLRTAKANGCIDSYKLRRDDHGVLASCINGLCEVWPKKAIPPLYLAWDIYFPGERHWNQRLDRFRAGSVMNVLQFHYNVPL